MDGGLEIAGNAVAQETASQSPPEPFRGDGQQIGRLFMLRGFEAAFPGPETAIGAPARTRPGDGITSGSELAGSVLAGTANNGVIAHGGGGAVAVRRRFGRVGSGSIGVTFPVQDLSTQR